MRRAPRPVLALGLAPPENNSQQCRSAVQHRPLSCRRIRKECAAYGSGMVGYVDLYYCADAAWRGSLLALLALWTALLFVWLGVSASEYLSPNIGALAQLLRMPESLAGVTLLALGNGAPDLASTFSAVRAGSAALAFGQIIGSASFIAGVVVGATTLAVPAYRVNRLSYLRELCFYTATVGLVAVVVLLEKLTQALAACMVALYVAYVATVVVTTYAEQQPQAAHSEAVAGLASRCHTGLPAEGQAPPVLTLSLAPTGHANDEHTYLLASSWAGAPTAASRRRQSAAGALGAEFDARDMWNLELLRAGSPPARALGDFLQQHRKSLLAAAECSDMADSTHESVSPCLWLATDTGSIHRTPLPLPPPPPLPNEMEAAKVCAASTRSSVHPNAAAPGASAEPAAAQLRIFAPAPLYPHQAHGRSHRRTASAPSLYAGRQPRTPRGIRRALPAPEAHSLLYADERLRYRPGSSSSSAASAVSPVSGGAPSVPPQMRVRVLAGTFVPTLRHWHSEAPVLLKLFIAFSALPVLALTLTVPVVMHLPQDEGVPGQHSHAHAASHAEHSAEHASRLSGRGSAVGDYRGALMGSPTQTRVWTPHEAESVSLCELRAEHQWAAMVVSYTQAVATAAFLCWALCYSGYLVPAHSLPLRAPTGACAVALVLGASSMCRAYSPRRRWLCAVPCFIGFVSGLVWVAILADEIISITQALGLVLGLSEEILGLTIVGFGNSLGDLVTNLTMARMGFPLMALSACFSGPMLSLLLGVGVAVCASIARAGPRSNPLDIPITSPAVFVSAACLAINTLLFLVAIPRQNYHMTRATGLSAFLVYSVGMAVNVYIEW
ncbi:hypothetical protein LPJ61_003781 [Coemansia biformis]|uniref:Sodium/calcium exchanger membrane region domain-containing protein n=1 Tax=Coemansia biformis TaxID=1286918 RepID=A0A9W7YBI5_9FUNG|nr:hypothetical protein LPJ61_003781 [Coemansia biformis]